MLVPSRSLDSVKHFPLLYNGHVYSFGVGEFSSIQELVEHFDNYPLIAGQAGECIQIAKKLIYSGWRCICRIQWSTKTEHSITQLYYHTCGQLLMSKHVVDVWCVSDISRDGHIRPMCKHNSWIMNSLAILRMIGSDQWSGTMTGLSDFNLFYYKVCGSQMKSILEYFVHQLKDINNNIV